MSSRQISLYVDTLLVETVLGNPHLHKRAGFVSDLLSKVKQYFESKIDKEHPAASVINMLAPGVLWTTFRAMGLGTWGLLVGLLMNVFHVDVYGILVSLFNKVKAMISSGNKVSSGQIDEAVNNTIQEHNSQEVSPQQMQEGYQKLHQMQSAPAADDGKTYSSLELMQDAKMIRLSMVRYEHESLRLTKTADLGSFVRGFSPTRAKGTSLLAKIFGWVFKIALGSAGLMIAGDVIRKFLGMDDHPETGSTPAERPPTSTQKKYRSKGDAPLSNAVSITNNPTNIDNMIIRFAKDTYSGLDGKEDLIRRTPGFQAIKEKIVWFNFRHPESTLTFIPPNFTSKKQLVDYFIDDVAKLDRA